MHKKIFTAFLLIAGLTACNLKRPLPQLETPIVAKETSNTPINKPADIIPTRDLDITRNLEFLSGKPCQAPCIFGVTPGKTTAEDAQSILESLSEHPACSKKDGVECSKPGIYAISISFDSQTGIVTNIRFSPTYYPPIYLGEILEYYGLPDHIDIWSPPDEVIYTQVSLLYDSIYTIVTLETVYGEKSNEISESSKVESFYYSTKGDYLDDTTLITLYPWKGYGVYP